jgi:hypothetical protein
MQPTYDSLGRRKRVVPVPTGKRVHPTPNDLAMFRALMRHGPLSSTYLHAFRSPDCKKQTTVERLTVLFNEDNTPHGDRYLTRPFQQNDAIDARYNDCVYDLTPASIQALKDAGEWHETPNRNPWKHAFMVAAITASIELACNKQGYRFIPWYELPLGDATPLRHPITFKTKSGERVTKDLIPDALFAIDYGGSFRAFALEADRSTEAISPTSIDRKSLYRNIKQYEQFVGEKLYKEVLGLNAPLTVLNVLVDRSRIDASLGMLSDCNYQTYQLAPEFGSFFAPVPVLYRLMDEPWTRKYKEPFTLKEKPRN